MNNRNDSNVIATGDPDLTPVIAQSIIDSLQGSNARSLAHAASAQQPWLAFAMTLDKLIASSPALKHAVEDAMARSARAAIASHGLAVPSAEDFLAGLRNPVTTRGGTVARAFWWGFHIQISHEDLAVFIGAAGSVNTIVGAIGGGVPSPAAPFIALAAAFIAGALGLLKALDRGSGVYVSMSWFAPGIFIPTSV